MCTYPLQQHNIQQNSKYYIYPYSLLQHKHTYNGSFPKLPASHVYISSTTTETRTQNSQSYMCIYHLLLHKHKKNIVLAKCPVLHVYIPSTVTQTSTKSLTVKITCLLCVHALYNSTNINTMTRFQNS